MVHHLKYSRKFSEKMGKGKMSKKRARVVVEKQGWAGAGKAQYEQARKVYEPKLELGRCDYTVGQSPITATPVFQCVNALQTGSGSWQREGDQVKLKSFHIRGQIRVATGAHGTYDAQNVRIMLVYDRQTNGAAPAAADLIYNLDQAGNVVATTSHSSTNYTNKKRFLVLMDEMHACPAVATAGGTSGRAEFQDTVSNVERYVKCKNLPTLYSASANPATVAQIVTGGLFLVLWSDTADGFNFGGQARLKFIR